MRGRKPNLATLTMASATDSTPAPVSVPNCPGLLKGEARAEWRRMAKLLKELGLIADLDRTSLAVHCQNWARWVDAETKIEEQGAIVKSPSGYPIQNPYVSIANGAAKAMQTLLAEFGLSPAARHKLLAKKKPKPANQAANKWGGLLANAN